MNPVESLLDFAKSSVPFHRQRAPQHHLSLENWPLMTKYDLADHALDKSDALLSVPHDQGGYLLLSGGTTGEAKTLFYSHAEAADACCKIAHNFAANGLQAGDRVANYFPAGHMYSSFLMVDRALSSLPVTILPLAFTPDTDFAIEILSRFRPNVITGIPSTILELARRTASLEQPLQIEKIFYAGEPMSPSGEARIKANWASRLIRSAGYASTDFGPIGWQCLHCQSGEHHVFDDVLVEIIDDEIVATSLNRRAMPLIRYRTGDGGEWVHGACPCGDAAGRFRLLGRIDDVVLIWGCRVSYGDIVRALKSCDERLDTVQVLVHSSDEKDRILVQFDPRVDESMYPALRDSIYRHSFDLQKTIPRAALDQQLAFRTAPAEGLQRNPRTKKVIPIIDAR